MKDRREFIKTAGIVAGTTFLTFTTESCKQINKTRVNTSKKMILRFKPYELQLKHVFTIATLSRTTTPVMLTEIEYDGIIGYGEASMPPYLGETHETVYDFLSKVDLSQFKDPFLIEDILTYIDQIAPGNYAAKASIDIAIHDLTGKILQQPWFRIWGLNPQNAPVTSFTIGIGKEEIVKQKTIEADPFKILKVKFGKGNDKEMIQAIRSVTLKPLCVDVNQGWTDRQQALDMIFWLKEQGIVFVEQPMNKTAIDDISWLTQNSPLPIIADESVQTFRDIKNIFGIYSGVNIKLMKCGGIRAAHTMIETARALNMKVMIGCMIETSCAVTAAAQLSPLVDWADLDGNLLIKNNIYDGLKVIDGKIVLPDKPGIGVERIKKM